MAARCGLLQLEPLDALILGPEQAAGVQEFDALASQEVFAPTAEAQVLGRFLKTGAPDYDPHVP